MNSSERNQGQSLHNNPKLLFDESVLDALPYKVSANMDEFGAFLIDHGMKRENVNKLSVKIQKDGYYHNRFSGITNHYRGAYALKSRTIHLATDWVWDEYREAVENMESVSSGEQAMLTEAMKRRFNEALLHEARHAIDYQDVEDLHKSTIKPLIKKLSLDMAVIAGASAACTGSAFALLKSGASLGVSVIPFGLEVAGISAYFARSILQISRSNKLHDHVYEFQEKHKDDLRWRSLASLTPK